MGRAGIALRKVREAVAQRFSRGPRILVYHRVTTLKSDPQWLAVRPCNFAAQLKVLCDEANVVSMAELRRLQTGGRIPDRTVAITFDDGYADNLLEAAPLLAARNTPATVYVSAIACTEQREFYWDELERLVLNAVFVPRDFALEVAGVRHEFTVGDEAPIDRIDQRAHLIWNATMPATSLRQKCYLRLCGILKPLDDPARQAALAQMRTRAGARLEVRASHRLLTVTELRLLAQLPGISIGAHGVTHAMLSMLSKQQQAVELQGSKARLEQEIGTTVQSFAYPYGSKRDFNADSVELARSLGFDFACANFSGVVRAGTDPYRLPRELVRDWTEEEFRLRLRRWLNG
jgi:peptidoglycan/xylan/chitin deacetylase (PgdA/CDA1 family)